MAGGVPAACGRIIGAGAFAYGAVGFLGFVIRWFWAGKVD